MSDQIKIRESNFELLRIVAILMVIVGHVNGIAFPAMTHVDVVDAPGICFSRMVLGQFCVVAVDVFILISGYFSIRPRLKSILNFAYLILFWRCLTYGVQLLSGDCEFSLKALVLGINPLKVWFIRDYITLMIFSPILNAFCESQRKDSFLKFIVCYYVIAFVGDFVVPLKLWGLFGGGYSFFSFVGLYLLGRYIRLYGCKMSDLSVKRHVVNYVVVSMAAVLLLFAVMYTTSIRLIVGRVSCFVAYYTSPFVVVGALTLFFAFSRISFHSRLVNHVALSVFAVYLSHSPTRWFWRCVHDVFVQCDPYGWVAVGILVMVVFVVTVLIDQVRIYSWRLFCNAWERKRK